MDRWSPILLIVLAPPARCAATEGMIDSHMVLNFIICLYFADCVNMCMWVDKIAH